MLRPQILSLIEQAKIYENKNLQEKARKILPISDFEKQAKKRLEILEKDGSSDVDIQDCLVLELLGWFKSFFSWFDAPDCKKCMQKMTSCGTALPDPQEAIYGQITVEVYVCRICQDRFRFPRYSHPEPLLVSRTGRCMEWASCFTLFCRSLDFEARYVWDLTDHVWTEIFSVSQNRWVHSDCCENKLDTPLMYEVGWNKKLSYIFAFSKDEAIDVTWRYSINHSEVTSRRKRCSEDWLAEFLYLQSAKLQENYPAERKRILESRRVREIASFFATNKNLKEGENEGRHSGSLSWRLSRGETKSNDSKESFTFIPCEQEIADKALRVAYSSARDLYVRPIESDCPKRGFRSCAYTSKNIFRKHETDWKTTYLCRTDTSAPSDSGAIEWKFSWDDTGLTLSRVFIVFQYQVFESGAVDWHIKSGTKVFPGNSRGVLDLSCESFEDGIQNFSLCAELSGGNSWQHSQLFRQKNDSDIWPFHVKITFK